MPIEEIPEIVVPSIWTTPPLVPVPQPSKSINLPVVSMPCALGRKDFTPNTEIYTDDPAGNLVLCPGIPSFEPIQYNPRKIQYVQEAKAPNPTQPDSPKASTESPKVEPPKPEVECPGPNQPRVGDLSQSGDEKVKGHKLSDDGQLCIVLYEPTTVVDKYLPTSTVVTTTTVIAVVATSSAILSKPLADAALKAIKPIVKKTLSRIAKIRGKEKLLSDSARRNVQRELRGKPHGLSSRSGSRGYVRSKY